MNILNKVKEIFSKQQPAKLPKKEVEDITVPKPKEVQQRELREIALLVEKHTGKVCKKCNGRGYESWNSVFGVYMVCDCIFKRGEEIRKEKLKKNELSFGQEN